MEIIEAFGGKVSFNVYLGINLACLIVIAICAVVIAIGGFFKD